MKSCITTEVLESYLACHYKAFLKLAGEHGGPCDYENLLSSRRQEVRSRAVDKICLGDSTESIRSNVAISTSLLAEGHPYLFTASIEDDTLAVTLDGIKKMSGVSKLGEFLYIPMLFQGGQRVRKEQRMLLDIAALLLSSYQTTIPTTGIILGSDSRTTTVRIAPDLRKAKQILREVKNLATAETSPPLRLNDHCSVCEFRQRCRDQAIAEDSLSLLGSLSETEIRKLNRQGILTVTQLAHTFRPRRHRKSTIQLKQRHYHSLQAMAVRDQKIYVLGKPELADAPTRIYLDVESDPDAGFVYLIGMIVEANGSEIRHSFWAESKQQEAEIFEQFLEEVARHDNFAIYCYGSYEKTVITRLRHVAGDQALVERVLASLVNVITIIYTHVYFPTYSNGLKEIGRYIGCSWSEPDASGIQSIVWRSRWESASDEEWKRKLLVYNMEDCAGLKRVTGILAVIVSVSTSEGTSLPESNDQLPITLVRDIEPTADERTWRKIDFVHSEYEFINNSAYFDYQRERVYVRTSPVLRKTGGGRSTSPNRSFTRSEKILIAATRCPVCDSGNVVAGFHDRFQLFRPRLKRAFDLAFTPTGIHRRILEVRTSQHRCSTCQHLFIPEEYLRLDRHFHGLKSWTMYQHVVHKMSLGAISKMIEDIFGIRVFRTEVYMFKSLMAMYYAPTRQRTLDHLLSGSLLHIDETEVKLRTGNGYVWVFTNLEEVVYMYRPTREGDFLHELLEGFQGVLVSDFYSAYDSIDCLQQKCLIHLMRDINQQLLANPFDDELKSITQPFGVLLRSIVTTIDQHGLRRRFLRHHRSDVDRFFRRLEEQQLPSEAADSLRTRLLKNREKLFTFLDHDGVPWNNNNAEHAIKQFAYYREVSDGTLTEQGLSDYLVMLGICQTCKYKGVSFLRYMLSKEQDVDSFCRHQRRKYSCSSIELYPKDFVPSHLHRKRKDATIEHLSNATIGDPVSIDDA